MLYKNWPDKKDKLLTVTQAATALNCTKEDVKSLVTEGRLTPIKALSGDVRYKVSMREVNRLLSKRI